MFDLHDTAAMTRALLVARRGEGHVEPNPMVGAVVAIRDDAGHQHIISEGWHASFGGPHAEIMALDAAASRARDATLFVTLEPCCHHGKTPPCTDAVIAAGITRVVIAARDPFPAVAGGGITALKAAGVLVEVGLLEREATRLTAPYRRLVESGRPWVIAKWAMSLDGVLATGSCEDRWLSSPASRRHRCARSRLCRSRCGSSSRPLTAARRHSCRSRSFACSCAKAVILPRRCA